MLTPARSRERAPTNLFLRKYREVSRSSSQNFAGPRPRPHQQRRESTAWRAGGSGLLGFASPPVDGFSRAASWLRWVNALPASASAWLLAAPWSRGRPPYRTAPLLRRAALPRASLLLGRPGAPARACANLRAATACAPPLLQRRRPRPLRRRPAHTMAAARLDYYNHFLYQMSLSAETRHRWGSPAAPSRKGKRRYRSALQK